MDGGRAEGSPGDSVDEEPPAQPSPPLGAGVRRSAPEQAEVERRVVVEHPIISGRAPDQNVPDVVRSHLQD